MRILPITVSADLIPPILEDRKIRTRRILQTQPYEASKVVLPVGAMIHPGEWHWYVKDSYNAEIISGFPIPTGIEKYAPWQKGDILYVREEHFAWGYWEDVEGEFTKIGKQKRKFIDREGYALFPNTFGCNAQTTRNGTGWHKRLARFMPKKYARIFLEVTDLRVERLQDITEDEALLEGVLEYDDGTFKNYSTQKGLRGEDGVECLMAIGSFQTLINRVNGPGTWDANPWVWVISFKRVERPANF